MNIPLPRFWLIVSAAFLVRAAFWLLQTRTHWFSTPFYAGDSHLYDSLARSLVGEGSYSFRGRPTAEVGPGYPLFLAAVYATVGRDFMAVGLVQCGLGAATVAAVYTMGRELFDEEVARVAALLAAFMPELIAWTSGQILTEPLYIPLLNSSLACLVLLIGPASGGAKVTRRKALLAGIGGGLLGLAALTRPVALGFAFVGGPTSPVKPASWPPSWP